MSDAHRRWASRAAVSAVCALALASPAHPADSQRAEIEALKQEIQELKRSDARKQRQIDEMMQLLKRLQPPTAAHAGEAAAPATNRTVAGGSTVGTSPVVGPTVAGAPTSPSAGTSPLDAALEASEKPPAPAAASGGPPTPTETTAGKLEIPASGPSPPTWLARPVPGATLRLLEPSVDILTAAGGSSAPDSDIKKLEGGEHDPKRRGFTLQQAELSLFGAVDPYFTGETHFVFTEDGVETEEAFATTTSLPWNLQVKAGYFLTDFGRINPTHPHSWPWVDQPIVNTRMFGGDGLRSSGVQINYLLPLPFYSELVIGAQNADNGGLTSSFFVPVGETTVGGRPSVTDSVANMKDLLYLVRSATSFDMTDDLAGLVGLSGLFGPNSSGSDARTYIYGADLTLKWRPGDNFRGWPFLVWQSEAIARNFHADAFTPVAESAVEESDFRGRRRLPGDAIQPAVADDDGENGGSGGAFDQPLAAATLRDWGFYTQLLYGFHHQWAAGIRYEFDDSSGSSVGGTGGDFLRDARHRVSPLLLFDPSEFSRLRLQYNYDNATFLPGSQASSIWLSLEILFGTHPAHRY